MPIDYNAAGEQRSFDLIPDRTIVTARLTIRQGGAGDDGCLTRSKDGMSEALDCELVVLDGPHAKRKFWDRMLVAGTTPGHQEAAEITGRRIRAILESARGIRPDDTGEAAKQLRRINNYGDLDGLAFMVRVGIEPASGNFKSKNSILEVITPERTDWHRPPPASPSSMPAKPPPSEAFAVSAATSQAALPAGRPAWAR